MSPFDFDDTRPLYAALSDWRMLSPIPHAVAEVEIRRRGDDICMAGDALISQYLELLSAYEQAKDEMVVQLQDLTDAVDDQSNEIALLVKWEHDRVHKDPWAICGHEMCRAAGRRVS